MPIDLLMKWAKTEQEGKWLRQYWNAQAQFGPFDVGPEEFLEHCRDQETKV